MGFMRLKVKEKETINNEEMFLAIKEQTERMLTSMIGDALAINGSDLDEIDPAYVSLFNKYVKQYKEMMDISLKWARYQDERDKRIEKDFENMQKFLDQQATLLREIDKKLTKKGGDAREA